MATSGNDGDAPRSNPPLAGVALVVAVLVIAVWLGLLIWLVVDVNGSEVAWSRQLVVLGSMEAIAFAAVGALFGTSVQRQRVADLTTQRDAAQSRADAEATAALNGHKLAAAVKATGATRLAGGTEQLSASGRPGSDPLVELANQLFPD
jgi:hypothetical protein